MHLDKLESKFQFNRFLDSCAGLSQELRIKQEVEKIIIPAKFWKKTKEVLSSSIPETVIFFFGKVKDKKALVTDVLIPSDKDYEERSSVYVSVSDDFVVKNFMRMKKENKTLVATIHSHSIKGLSQRDLLTHINVIKHYPYQLTGIFHNGQITFYKLNDGIKEVRAEVLDLKDFDRQIRIFGESGQILISSSSVALIGVGGGNTRIAFDLASLGIGKLLLIDPD